MKKIIIALSTALVALLCFTSTAFAQAWRTEYVPGDELKGTEGYYSNYYFDEENNLAGLILTAHKSLGVTTNKGIFDYDSYNSISVLIGYYVDGKLESKETVSFRVSKSDSSTAFCFSSAVVDRVAAHLAKGEVRLVLPRYGRSDLDMTLPKYTELK